MEKSKDNVFFRDGLYFSCIRCSDCCRLGPGHVYLSEKDVQLLAEGLQMKYTDVMDTYCRWVPSTGGKKQLSLREKPGFDCIFWQDGCKMYNYRPLQCRTFPFWDSILCSRDVWESLNCPGAGKGAFHSREYIESCLNQRESIQIIAEGE